MVRRQNFDLFNLVLAHVIPSAPANFFGLDIFLGLDTLVWPSWTRYVRHVFISDGQKIISS